MITTKAVLRFDENNEACLDSVHPGIEIEDVLSNTGWKLQLANNVKQTAEPSSEELQAIREYDRKVFGPARFGWIGRSLRPRSGQV